MLRTWKGKKECSVKGSGSIVEEMILQVLLNLGSILSRRDMADQYSRLRGLSQRGKAGRRYQGFSSVRAVGSQSG